MAEVNFRSTDPETNQEMIWILHGFFFLGAWGARSAQRILSQYLSVASGGVGQLKEKLDGSDGQTLTITPNSCI